MMRYSRLLAVLLFAFAPGCSDDTSNPFDDFSLSRPPSDDAVVIYASGAWAGETGRPRELFAVNADGTDVQRLTTCTEQSEPCDYLDVAPSSNRDRIVAVRGAVGGDPLASALFFVDLGRSVETIIAPARRVQGADWSIDDAFVVFTADEPENLFFSRPNGDELRPLTQSPDQRERSPRLDRTLAGVALEVLDATPGKSVIAIFLGADDVPSVTTGGPGTEVLPGTPYVVGSDASPAFAPDSQRIVFRRLTGTGNGGLGTWDLYTIPTDEPLPEPVLLVGGGDVYRGSPDWSEAGIVFVETDSASSESRMVVIQPDGSGRLVLHSEDAGYRMRAPRWLRPIQ
jgi:Tol biopolymer transport system component